MLRITSWDPDTCECKVNFSWDDEVPVDQRVFKYVDPMVTPALTLTVKEPIFERNRRGHPIFDIDGQGARFPRIIGHNSKTITVIIEEFRCPHHLAAIDLYEACQIDNKLKNKVINQLAQAKILNFWYDKSNNLKVRIDSAVAPALSLDATEAARVEIIPKG